MSSTANTSVLHRCNSQLLLMVVLVAAATVLDCQKSIRSETEGMSKCPPNREEYSSLIKNVPLFGLLELKKSEIILSAFTVRVYTAVGGYAWARLWYLLRWLNSTGSGRITIEIELLEIFLGCSRQSLRRWLSEGKKCGAFRYSIERKGFLHIYLGSVQRICIKTNVRDWCAVAVVPIADVLSGLLELRQIATGATTQYLQQRSRYAANVELKPEHRKIYGAPHPNEIFGDNMSCSKSDGGQHFILHISETRLFVSKGFVAYGASQHGIAITLGISPRTVQRHHASLKTVSRQLCQSKSEYAWCKRAFEMEAPEYIALNDSMKNGDVGYRWEGDTIHFMDGKPLGAKTGVGINRFKIPAGEFGRRIFKVGKKQPRYFLAKCNIYRETYTLTTTRALRSKFKRQLAQANVTVVEKNSPF